MTQQLHDRLDALARLAPSAPLDLSAARRTARHRRRVRRVLGVLPVLGVLLLVAALLQPASRPPERLLPATPAVIAGPLSASVAAEIVPAGPVARLAVTASDGVFRLGARRAPSLTFHAVTEQRRSFGPWPYWSRTVRSDDGRGVLGLAGPCGRGWDSAGRPAPEPCLAALHNSFVSHRRSAPLRLALFPRVGDERARPGTYRTQLRLRDGDLLKLTVTVSGG